MSRTAIALARWTASAPPRTNCSASPAASAATASVNSITRVPDHKSSQLRRARRSSAGRSRCDLRAAASAALTSGNARRLVTTVSASSHSRAATSLPDSSTRSLTRALLSKQTATNSAPKFGDEVRNRPRRAHASASSGSWSLCPYRARDHAVALEALENSCSLDRNQAGNWNPTLGHDDVGTCPGTVDPCAEVRAEFADRYIHTKIVQVSTDQVYVCPQRPTGPVE